ncbi:MAG: MMPL family transporter [Desulfosalsimonadaceae bacterium]
MINAYLKLVIKHPLLFLSLLAAITAGLGLGMLNLRFDHSIEAFMPKSDPEYRQYQKAKDMFGDNSRFLLLAVSNAGKDKPLWSPAFMKAFGRLVADIEAYKDSQPDKAEGRLQRLNRLLDQPEITFDQLTEAFAKDPVFVRLLKRKTPSRVQEKDRLSPADRERLLNRIGQDMALKRAEMIDTLLSPFTANDISGKNDVLATYPLVETDSRGDRMLPETPEAIAAFKARLKKNPAFKDGIYAYDDETGKITDFGILVKFTDADNRPAMVEEILAITDFHDDLEIYVSGVPYVSRQFNLYMEKDLYRSTPIVLMVVVLVFFINFKSVRGVLLPFSTLAMAELWTLGLLGHLGYPITSIGITLPPLLISVGSSYAIHVLNKYYTDFNLIDPKDKSASLQSIMGHISVTVLLAGLTTAAAFATLTSSQISAIQQWAIFASLGILFAVLISLTLIPAVLRLLPHHYPKRFFRKDRSPEKTLVDRLLAATARTAVNHYKAVYIIVFIVIAVSIAGMLRLRVNTEFLHPVIGISSRLKASSSRPIPMERAAP